MKRQPNRSELYCLGSGIGWPGFLIPVFEFLGLVPELPDPVLGLSSRPSWTYLGELVFSTDKEKEALPRTVLYLFEG